MFVHNSMKVHLSVYALVMCVYGCVCVCASVFLCVRVCGCACVTQKKIKEILNKLTIKEKTS